MYIVYSNKCIDEGSKGVPRGLRVKIIIYSYILFCLLKYTVLTVLLSAFWSRGTPYLEEEKVCPA